LERLPVGFFGLLGLVTGSFLNVCIYRLPRKESLVWPGSHCPSCGRRLTAPELVPVLSYLILKGKCRTCGFSIPARYPVVEAVTGVVFYWAAANANGSLDFARSALFLTGLIVVFFIDLEHGLIPDSVTLPLLAVGLGFAAAGGESVFQDRLSAAGGGFFLFWGIYLVGTWLLKKEAMGGGDLKLAAMMGAFLGVRMLAVGLFLGFLFGALVSLWLMATGRKHARDAVPFGPMLAMGGVVAFMKGADIINWYGGLMSRLWF
jgi:leader peptidase (prepilin peptidase) / N-methyltransferase